MTGKLRRRDSSPQARSFTRIGGAVAFLAVCAAGGIVLYQNAGDTVSVVSVREGVSEGETIERSDLVSKQVAGVDDAVLVEDAEALEGQTAAVDLLPGQVVTTDAVTSDPVPGKGERTVGLSLTAPQMPDGLLPGDTVSVIAVPSSDSSDNKLDDPTVLVEQATVYRVSEATDASEGRPVTVVVPDDEAIRVASYASAGRVAIVEAPVKGG